MTLRDPGVYLEDIEYYAAAAVRFTSGYSLDQYLADDKTRAAVERVLEVCGEAMRNLDRAAPTVAEKIPHARDIIGFRNILAHGYAELDHHKVYSIAIASAPELLTAVQEALRDFPDPTSDNNKNRLKYPPPRSPSTRCRSAAPMMRGRLPGKPPEERSLTNSFGHRW